ncbi:MAG: phosphotransferase [Saprospiraceae bacterium]
MRESEVNQLLEEIKKGLDETATLIETHISWVILTKTLVFKIKKPVKFSFLDFSTLDQRKHYCERELQLNNRLTSGIYLEVLPIRKTPKGLFSVTSRQGEIMDYTVKMKRLDTEKQMNVLLTKHLVGPQHMEQIAAQLATFHASSAKVGPPPDLAEMQQDFADIAKIKNFLSTHLGKTNEALLDKAILFSEAFLRAQQKRIRERYESGFVIDGHGDLHSKNIFLLDQPVIFDCIEFNDHFRYLDVLNELAFLCMDLDAYGQADLGVHLMEKYNTLHPILLQPADQLLFQYFKWYRANVRLKVSGLKLMSTHYKVIPKQELEGIKIYLTLFENYYLGLITNTSDATEIKLNAD